MSKANSNTPVTELQGLIADRQKYEGWLNTLRAKQGSVPEAVYAKVHGDYQKRLDEVLANLASRTDELNSQISSLETQVNEYNGNEQELLNKRQEAELRTAVGEYTQDQWTHESGDIDDELSLVREERGKLQTELDGLKKILALSTQPLADREVTESIDSYVAEVVTDVEVTPPEPEKQADGVPAQEVPEVTGASIPGLVGASTVEEVKEEAVFAPQLSYNPYPPSSSPPSEEMQASQAPETTPSAPEGAAKSLKCPECGASNYPTEWYCEKCGGELAAL